MTEGPPQLEEGELEQAKKLILDVNSLEYVQGHNFGNKEQSAITPVVLHYKMEDKELVAIGAPHTYAGPEHPMLKKIRGEFEDYVQRTPQVKRIVMVEGFHTMRPKAEATLEESARRGEPTMVTFLAKQSGSDVISPEAPSEKVLADLLEKGMSRENLALFHVLQTLRGITKRGESLSKGRLSLAIVWIEREFHPGWVRKFTPEEIEKLKVYSNFSEEVAGEIINEAVPKINEAMKSVFKEDLFELGENGETEVVADEKTIFESVDPSPWVGNVTVVNLISRIIGDTRDSYILEKLDEAVRNGKSPFIVYGRSHIIRLKPALDYLFTGKT